MRQWRSLERERRRRYIRFGEVLIGELLNAASAHPSPQESATCRKLARNRPEEVVEIVREALETPNYREVLRTR